MARTMNELVEEYREVNRHYCMEGDRGLKNLEELLRTLGYEGHQFKYGTIIESFLSDNSGALEAIVNWIGSQNNVEWREQLEEVLPPTDLDDEEDDEDFYSDEDFDGAFDKI
jgi:hypothetical protein